MALSASALVTWEQTKLFLKLQDSVRDEFEQAIEIASSIVCRRAGRILALQEHEEQLDGTGTEEIMLSQYPVQSVTSIEIDRTRAFGEGSQVTGWYAEAHGVVSLPCLTPLVKGSVRVVYMAGFDVAGGKVPGDLQEVVFEIVAWLRKRVGTNLIGVRSLAGLEGLVTTYETQIPLHAANHIDAYCKKVR